MATSSSCGPDLFDQLHAKIPLPSASTPDLGAFQKSLERHYFVRNQSSARRRRQSPTSDRTGAPRQDATEPIRSSSASPRPARTRPAMVNTRATMTRPPSELFLPSPPPMFPTYDQAPFLNTRASFALAAAVAELEGAGWPFVSSEPKSSEITPVVRSSTAPASLQRTDSLASTKSMLKRTRSARSNGSSSRGAGVRAPNLLKKRGAKCSGIDKDITAAKRASAIATKRRSGGVPFSPLSPVASSKPASAGLPVQMPWRRRKRGETMSMLLDAGFFPVHELIYNDEERIGINASKRKSMRLNLNMLDLPLTPTSITGTPVELYQQSLPSPRAQHAPRTMTRNRTLRSRRRSVLVQRSVNGGLTSPISPAYPADKLAAISEDDAIQAEVAASSGEIMATEIHLATGTVLTVTPPELTPWQRSIYVQGPIKLLMPVVMPRNHSIASLEPFQEAVEQAYRTALLLPCRRSDDTVYDDICEWYDDFGFADVSFEHDVLSLATTATRRQSEATVTAVEATRPAHRSLEPPSPAPIEKEIAADDALESAGYLDGAMEPRPKTSLVSIQVAKLNQIQRDAEINSNTLSTQPRPLPQDLPSPPDGSTHPLTRTASLNSNALDARSKSSFDWDVEEVSSKPAWLLPNGHANHRAAAVYKPLPKKSQNPVMKMRRLVQTASAIL